MTEQNQNVAQELGMPQGVLETLATGYIGKLSSDLRQKGTFSEARRWQSDDKDSMLYLAHRILTLGIGKTDDKKKLEAITCSMSLAGWCTNQILSHSVVQKLEPDASHMPFLSQIDPEVGNYGLISDETYILAHPTLKRIAQLAARRAWPEEDRIRDYSWYAAGHILVNAESQVCDLIAAELTLHDTEVEIYADALPYAS